MALAENIPIEFLSSNDVHIIPNGSHAKAFSWSGHLYLDCLPCSITAKDIIKVCKRDGEKHKIDVKTLEEKKYTRSRKKDSLTELHPSAITDHIAKENHTIDWKGVKFPARDTD